MAQVKVGGENVATLRPTDQEVAEELDCSSLVNVEGDLPLSLKTRAVFAHPLFCIPPSSTFAVFPPPLFCVFP